jgi:GDPmannose 4,6-dehydratase
MSNTSRIDYLYQDPHTPDRRLILPYGDLTDTTNLIRIIRAVQPDEVYDFGSPSHVQVSIETPKYSANADAMKQRRG